MCKQYFEVEIEIVTILEDIVTASENFGPVQFDNTADDVYDFIDQEKEQ